MNPSPLSFARSTAILFLCLSAVVISTAPIACSSTGAPGGAGGSTGAVGTGGSKGTGGNVNDAGTDARAGGSGGRAGGTGADARDTSGAGGTIITVDAAGNTLTCADLLACCNRVTNAQAMALCLQQYNTLRTQGDPACGNLLTQIRANGGCP